MLKTLSKKYQIEATISQKVIDAVANLMADQEFLRSLHDFISAAHAAIQVGHKQSKPEMVKFNALSLAFFEAVKKKDVGAANSAADALVKAGHGEAFGLK